MTSDNTNFLKFIKLIKTGQIVSWENYDPLSQKFEIVLPNGVVSSVHQGLVKRISANEELAFLILSKTHSN
jgi:hypothetical protein